MHKTSVDFIIPTASHTSSFLISCQKSILAQVGPFEKKIFIETGFGFTKGINRGIQRGKSSYIALINDDVILDKNWLQEVVLVLEKYPRCAAVATRVLTEDGRYIDSCGMDIMVKGKAQKRGNGQEKNKKFMREEEVFGVPCSAALIRRKAFEKVGLFDENFVAYEEDVDLSFRLRLAGFTIFYAPKAIAFHKVHATSKNLGNFKARMDAKNWIYIIIKNYPLPLLFHFVRQIIVERFRNAVGLIKETIHFSSFKSLWILPWSFFATYGDVVKNIPNMLIKRKKIQKGIHIEYIDLIHFLKTT